ncbi:MAG TPA: hypothetical protein PKH39_15720 [Woeseiaceae bacterium]|nr:hypothetical protein [Woeseiaceae bacterium]
MRDEIDIEEFLADLDQIAAEAGDWRDHLPYEAACAFEYDANIRSLYVEHVSGCQYCQELVALFGLAPSDRVED